MRKRHIFFIIIFFTFLFSTTAIGQAQVDKAMGCCKKTEVDNPDKITTVDLLKEACDLVQKQGPWTVEFLPDHFADGNRCEKKVATTTRKLGDPIFFTPSVTIPDSNIIEGQKVKIEDSTTSLANYIVAIFKYSTGVIGIIAAIVLMLAGIMWLTAAGNQEQIGAAKNMIGGGLMGLILTFGAFIILSVVNTNLVNLKITPVTKIENITLDFGCCAKTKTVDGQVEETAENLSGDACSKLAGYSSVKFTKDWVAEGNKCINPVGCCFVQANSFHIILEGKTVSELCYNKVYEKACKEKETSAFRQWSFGILVQTIDLANQVKQNKSIYEIVGDIDTEWQRGRCQDWTKCEDITVAEKATPR